MNELCAELDGDVRRQVVGVNPSADSVAGLDQGHPQARAREQASGGKSGHSCPDDQHIDGSAHSWVSFCHMRIIRQSSFAAVPWKNGGGVTREAIRVPPHGDPFDWRVSLAQIDTDGPFSDFAGYIRFMVLLKGAGVVLKFAGGPAPRIRELREIGDMQEFDGGVGAHCELVNGPCVDLNLMVSKNLRGVRTRVESLREARSFTVANHESMLVFPIDAEITLAGDASTEQLAPWDLAVLSGRRQRDVKIVATGCEEGSAAARLFVAVLPGV